MINSAKAALCALLPLLCACGGHEHARITAPAVPTTAAESKAPVTNAKTAPQGTGTSEVPREAKPLFTEVGLASWYGPPYHNRRGSNGEIYDMYQLTAAHRTLPLNSVVRVTNLKNGRSALVRITDRGPFVPNRIIDLSLSAAKATDVWRAGTARVRVDVLQTPASMGEGGRWCVQIGAIHEEQTALKLKDRLEHRYRSAKVLAFTSPVGDHWVRVRVANDEKNRAEQLIRENSTPEGSMYLVRLD